MYTVQPISVPLRWLEREINNVVQLLTFIISHNNYANF